MKEQIMGVESKTATITHVLDDSTAHPIAGEGRRPDENHPDNADTCNLLRELHRQRQDLHRAEKSLTLQVKAKCRRLCGGDKDDADEVYLSMQNGCSHDLAMHALATSLPFINARGIIESERKSIEKQMSKAAKSLPVYEWVKEAPGFSEMGLASIVGESGDLSQYSTVSKLWKRLGLAVIDGGRQRRVAGPDALLHGYSPSRRSVVWQYGEPLIKCKGPYRNVYLSRVITECEKATAENLIVASTDKALIARWEKRGSPPPLHVAKITEDHRTAGHIHNRAKRYMEKRLIRDLWRAWRDYSAEGQTPCDNHYEAA